MTDLEHSTQERARQIAAQADDVRRQTQCLVVDALKSGKESIGHLPSIAMRVFDGAWRGVEEVTDEKRADVLRDVIDGLSDGMSQGAHAVKLTIEEAKSRGESFTEDEIKSAAEDLRALESMFVERIEVLAKSSATETSQQAGDLVSHARNALSSIQPDIASAITAVEQHPVGLVKETASVAVGVSRRAAGSLLQGIAGVLESFGDAVDGGRPGSGDK